MAGLITGIIITACFFIFYPALKPNEAMSTAHVADVQRDTIYLKNPIALQDSVADKKVVTDSGNRDSIVAFAKTLLGVPYLYASMDPSKGFDCSGFINYVFQHFNIVVPRSSYEFEKAGKQIPLEHCKKGDLILFTGTNPEEKNIGHIGLVIDTTGGHALFIHSSSGKANGVTVTSMESAYYQSRFVMVVDMLP
ncbi:MAG: C40 family peptidase [Ferruginibacter sp.]